MEKIKRALMGLKAAAARAVNHVARDWLAPVDFIVLIRARREEEISVSYAGVAGCLIAGIIMAVAKPLTVWLTGIDPDNPTGIPPEVASMFSKLLTLIMYLGVVMVVIGLIWAGLNLSRRWKKSGN